ncbi:MAG TPA: response regulator [Flavisolibacter sp.]|nr:response regulator [Flavisolibacter sp.]
MTKALPNKSLVLYADDDPDDLDLVKEAFSIYAYAVDLKTFKDGVELLKEVSTMDPYSPLPCLIILDINMPRMNGKEVLHRLRNMRGYENVPIVLFSTSTLPSEREFARSFGAGFITKPLYTEQIHLLIEQMLDHCSDELQERLKRKR